jgi:secondary thiamine-phosphate synthase enzyme
MAVNLFVSEKESPTFKVASDLVHLRSEEHLQFVDLTELVRERVRRSGVWYGLVNIQARHTTTAIVVNENEPYLLEDIEDLLERWAPRDAPYRHNDLAARSLSESPGERENGHSHARAVFLGASESMNIVDGNIQLGPWQRIFLVELDGVRERSVSIVVMGVKHESEDDSACSY